MPSLWCDQTLPLPAPASPAHLHSPSASGELCCLQQAPSLPFRSKMLMPLIRPTASLASVLPRERGRRTRNMMYSVSRCGKKVFMSMHIYQGVQMSYCR